MMKDLELEFLLLLLLLNRLPPDIAGGQGLKKNHFSKIYFNNYKKDDVSCGCTHRRAAQRPLRLEVP
jgi:hypothetical protein